MPCGFEAERISGGDSNLTIHQCKRPLQCFLQLTTPKHDRANINPNLIFFFTLRLIIYYSKHIMFRLIQRNVGYLLLHGYGLFK